MACTLYKHKESYPIYWVSKVTGKKYEKENYINHGYGGLHKGYYDLPKDEYPYTLEFHEYPKFKCCRVCNCEK